MSVESEELRDELRIAQGTITMLREALAEANRRTAEARVTASDEEPWVWSDDDDIETTVAGFGNMMVVRITGGHLRALIAGAVKAEHSIKHAAKALDIAESYGGIDGGHHKMWVIDQMVRALTGCPMVAHEAVDYRGKAYTYQGQGESESYAQWKVAYADGEDGPETYEWQTGGAP